MNPESGTELRIGARDRDKQYSFLAPDGLVSTDEIRTEEITILDHVSIEPTNDVLVVEGNYGVLSVILADISPQGQTVVTETSARAANSCQENAARNHVQNHTVELTSKISEIRDEFDVVVYAPKPYSPIDVVNQRIVDASTRLSTDGEFYVAGTKSNGVTRFADTLSKLFGAVDRRTVNGDCHLYCATKTGPVEPRQFLDEYEFRASVGDYTCRFLTVPGLFSWQSLDAGTRALLKTVSVPDGSRVLDCCCGYGAIGSFIGARSDCEIWATDDNIVATTYAEQNFERNGVTPETVVTGDCTDAVSTITFDIVLSNPPTHAGRGITKKLFSGIHDVLVDDGSAYFVANEIMNYDEKLSREFAFDSKIVEESGKYDVIQAIPQ